MIYPLTKSPIVLATCTPQKTPRCSCWQAEAATWRMWDGNCHFGCIWRIFRNAQGLKTSGFFGLNDGVFVCGMFVGIVESDSTFGGFNIENLKLLQE